MTLPSPVDHLGVRGQWPVCPDGYVVEGSYERPPSLTQRWLVPVSERHRFVYLDEERGLVPAVRRLAKVAGRTFSSGPAEEELLHFAGKYGFPAMPALATGGYRLSLHAVAGGADELSRLRPEVGWDRR